MSNPLEPTVHRSIAGQHEERLLNAFFVLCKTARLVE